MHLLHRLIWFFPVCIATLVAICQGHSVDWDYGAHGPQTWGHSHKKFCAGVKQSPVELSVQQSIANQRLEKFHTRTEKNISAADITVIVKNDGHKLELSWSPSEMAIRMGLDCDHMTHTAKQLHWHWGSDDTKGSEHSLDNKNYAAEGHLVFFNEADYYNTSNAVDKPYGLAVLGVFYQVSTSDNPLLKKLEPALQNIAKASSESVLTFKKDEFNLINEFLPSSTDEYFRYDGSLTTPPCFESVLWTVFRQPVPISQRQLSLLRSLNYTDNSSMVNNFRPPLPLNPAKLRLATPRSVYRSFEVPSTPTTAAPAGAVPGHNHIHPHLKAASTLPRLAPAALATFGMAAMMLLPALGL